MLSIFLKMKITTSGVGKKDLLLLNHWRIHLISV